MFAPLANRLGLWQLKWELEDLAFRFLQPDDYRRIAAGACGEARRPRALHHRAVPHARVDDARGRHRRRGVRAPQTHLQHPSEDGAQAALVRAGVRPARGAHRHRDASKTATPCSGWCTDAIPTSRASSTTTSPRRRTTSTARSTPRCSVPRASRSKCRSARARCTTRPSSGWPPIGATRRSRAHDVSYDRKIEWVRKLLDSIATIGGRRSRLPRRGARRAVRGSRLRAHAQG